MDQADLIARVIAGDAVAEREFYDAHDDRIYRLAYRMTGDAMQAEDLTQETFVRAFGRMSGFRGEAMPSTWLHAVAVSVILNAQRKEKRRRQWEQPGMEFERLESGSSPSDTALKVRLGRAIDRLPEALRLVFVMHDVEGFLHREIADILAVPEGTSKTRLARARELLRQVLVTPAGVVPKEM